jgi:hypothetical protein
MTLLRTFTVTSTWESLLIKFFFNNSIGLQEFFNLVVNRLSLIVDMNYIYLYIYGKVKETRELLLLCAYLSSWWLLLQTIFDVQYNLNVMRIYKICKILVLMGTHNIQKWDLQVCVLTSKYVYHSMTLRFRRLIQG